MNDPATPSPEKHPWIAHVERTFAAAPCVTRALCVGAFLTYFASWVWPDLEYALACIPLFVFPEIYRLLTGLLVHADIFFTLGAGWFLLKFAAPLESTIGSAQFVAVHVVAVQVLTSVAVTAVAFVCDTQVTTTTSGLWNIILAMVSASKRGGQIFTWDVPASYYPWVLCLLVSFMKRQSMVGYAVSTVVGFSLNRGIQIPTLITGTLDRYGSGYKQWVLAGGPGHDERDHEHVAHHRPTPSMNSNSSSGRALGGANPRRVDARAARLQALEQV